MTDKQTNNPSSPDDVFPTPNGGITRAELEKIGLYGTPPDFMRPVLFLDNDGVINIDAIDRDQIPGIRHHTIYFPKDSEFAAVANNATVYWHQYVTDILRMTNSIWCTSWKKLAFTELNKIYGFEFPWLDWHYRGTSDWGCYGKSKIIGDVVRATGCEWVVADDELGEYEDMIEMECDKSGTIICPDHELGLTTPDLKELLSALDMTFPSYLQ